MGQWMAAGERVVVVVVVQTNLRVLKKSRRAPEPGDVFAAQLPDGGYLFGRVILANVPQRSAPMPGANLIYIYSHRSPAPTIDEGKLLPGRLLLPPVWTNNLAWTKGYFYTVANQPLRTFDLLRQHCFRRVALRPGVPEKFLDEGGLELKHRYEPCGEWALASYRWIDDHVSDAMGVPRVPDE